MKKFMMKITLLVTMSSTLLSQSALAAEIKLLPDFSCLTREQKESIAICFGENDSCHESLKSVSAGAYFESPWQSYLLAGILGLAAGMIAQNQLRH